MKKICLLIYLCFNAMTAYTRPIFDLTWGSYLGDGTYLISNLVDGSYQEGTFIAHSKFEWGNLVANYNMNDRLYSYHYTFNFTNYPFFNVEVTAHGSSHNNDAAHVQDFTYYGEGFCLGQQCQFVVNMNNGSLIENFTFTERGLLRSARFKFVDEAGNTVKTIIWTETLLRMQDSYYENDIIDPISPPISEPPINENN